VKDSNAEHSIKEAPPTDMTNKIGSSYMVDENAGQNIEEEEKSGKNKFIKKKSGLRDDKELPLLAQYDESEDGDIVRKDSHSSSIKTVDLGDLGDDEVIRRNTDKE
jgi:hypothetical protein